MTDTTTDGTDRSEFMAEVNILHAKKLDKWAAERREEGKLPVNERREAFYFRKEARTMYTETKRGDDDA